MSKPDFKVMAPVRRRVDEDKTDLFIIGSAWTRSDGNISVKVSTLPIGPWDGQIYLFRDLDDEQKRDDKVTKLKSRRDTDDIPF